MYQDVAVRIKEPFSPEDGGTVIDEVLVVRQPHYTACEQDQDGVRPDPARKLSARLYDIYHCCVYSEELLMMDRGTVRNM